MKKENSGRVWLYRVTATLLILVLVSSFVVSGMLARYTSSASGADSARVAKFEVEESGTLTSVFHTSIGPGEEVGGLTVAVKNIGEVAIRYHLSVVNATNNLPLAFAVKEGETVLASAGSVFTNEMGIGKTAKYELFVKWPGEQNDAGYMGMVDLVRITLTAEQID